MGKLGELLCRFGRHEYSYRRIVADAGLSASIHELRECRYCPATRCFSNHKCHEATYEEVKALNS